MILKHQHFDIMQKTVLERLVFKPPITAPGAMHNEACFLYVKNGRSKIIGENQSEPLISKESVVMKCGNYLNSWYAEPGEEPSEAIGVHFYPEVLKYVFEDKLPDFLKQEQISNTVSIQRVKVDLMIDQYVESLMFYFENPTIVTDELIILKVKELIMLLVNTDESNRIRNILKDLFNPDEYSFKDVIQKNLYEDLSVDELAMLTNLSSSSFKRKFKEVFDDSPARFIKLKRLEKAADLLVLSNQRVTDICYECGFNDIGHFSKSFTSEYGESPSNYRESRLRKN